MFPLENTNPTILMNKTSLKTIEIHHYNNYCTDEVDEQQKAGLESLVLFRGDENKEAPAMASIGWKKRAELLVCRRRSSLLKDTPRGSGWTKI
ncbi:hypothetical protein Q3G72_005400 [Acer saccharum]|nr:hypothetical protein Q3G72_005400 [Acer saccharum]